MRGGADACLGCTYQREVWRLARDVDKLRKALKSLRGCSTTEGCTRCSVPQSCTCQEHCVAIIDKVLAATAKKGAR